MKNQTELLLRQAIEEIKIYHLENIELKEKIKKLEKNQISNNKDTISEFNEEIYIKRYPDVIKSGLAPKEHYIRFGKLLGRNAKI